MRSPRRLLLALAPLVLGCEPPLPSRASSDVAPLDPAAPEPLQADDRAEPDLYERVARGEPTAVLVIARGPAARVQEGALESEGRVERRYEHLPIVAMTLSSDRALRAVARHPDTVLVVADTPNEAFLTQSLSLIDQPVAVADGKIGAGATVAVLDTGVKYTLSAFGSCTAPGAPATCKVSAAQDFAPSDGLLDDASGHGTNVAAIVLGVAPGARIVALDVFRPDGTAWSSDILAAIDWVIANQATYHIAAMNLSLGSGAFAAPCPNDALAVGVASARAAGVLSAIATGNRGYTNRVASPACAPSGISVGAVYDANVGAMAWTPCADATTAADKVTCFSDSASFLTMLAPGALITAAGATFGGTSQAAPHVAGALAVLRGAFPNDTAEETIARLTGNGVLVTDPRNNVTTPRLDVGAAASDCVSAVAPLTATQPYLGGSGTIAITAPDGCPWTAGSNAAWMSITSATSGTGSASVKYTATANVGSARTGTLTVGGQTIAVTQWADAIAPTGSVTIAGGAAATKAAAVALSLPATDGSGVASMCVSNTASCTAWTAYAAASTWTLASGDGAKTVSVWFKDGAGNTSAVATDTIVLDTALPTNGTLMGTPASASALLSWSGFADPTSGVASYTLVAAAGSPPATCATGTVVASGTGTSATHSGLTNGVAMGYRVCAVDAAGNVSAGATATVTPSPEQTAPTGTLTINGGAAATTSASVTLLLAASDASGVTSMCVSNTATCTAFEPFAASRAWTLASGSGAKIVRAWFKDAFGNTSAPAPASIVLDTVPPIDGAVVATPATGAIGLSWTGFADATTDVVSYRLVAAPTTPPTTCTAGTLLYAGTAKTFTHTGLTNGAAFGYRVCARDGAGNTSTGATVTSFAAPEVAPPTGTVTIEGGAAVVGTKIVTLTLAATDPSGVASMCVSNGATCTAWQPYATTLAWALVSGSGAKTVSAWFKDAWGNASVAAATDSVVLDTASPAGGTLVATGASGQVTLSWSGFSDTVSGVASYKLVGGATLPASCGGTPLYAGAATSYTHAGLVNGVPWAYRVCALDGVGNTSAGATAQATPAPEYVLPTGTLTVNGGAAATANVAVTLALSASDASGVTEMCVTNALTCTAWEAYATSRAWKLSAANGTKTVRVFFSDTWGNVSAAVTDSIVLDTAPPVNGKLVPTALAGGATLAWSGFADETTSVVSYLVVSGATAAPACTAVAPLYSGSATTFTKPGLPAGVLVYFRVCGVDAAGNVGTGTTVKVTPL